MSNLLKLKLKPLPRRTLRSNRETRSPERSLLQLKLLPKLLLNLKQLLLVKLTKNLLLLKRSPRRSKTLRRRRASSNGRSSQKLTRRPSRK